MIRDIFLLVLVLLFVWSIDSRFQTLEKEIKSAQKSLEDLRKSQDSLREYVFYIEKVKYLERMADGAVYDPNKGGYTK